MRLRRPLRDTVWSVAALFGILAIWEMTARLSGLNPSIFPPPSSIVRTLLRLAAPSSGRSVLGLDIGASLLRLAFGLAIGVPVGLICGLAAGINRYAYSILYPLVNVLIPVPPYAWVPLLLVWLGPGDTTIIAATALSASLPLAYTTMAGVRGIDRLHVWVMQGLGGTRGDVIRQVLLPGALASILAGLRLSLGQSWRTLIGAEFLAARGSGLGFLIYNAQQFLAVNTMFAGLLTLGALGFLLIYWLVTAVEDRTLVRWGVMSRR
jgi:taurine transport system permease protein